MSTFDEAFWGHGTYVSDLNLTHWLLIHRGTRGGGILLKCNVRIISVSAEITFFFSFLFFKFFFYLTIALMNWNVNKHDGRAFYLRWGGKSQAGNTEQLAQFFSHSKASTTLGLSSYETYVWTSLGIFLVLSSTFFSYWNMDWHGRGKWRCSA